MPRSERNKSIDIAFVVTPANIRSIDSILERIGEERSYSIRCSDHSIILFDDINELIDFPNSASRRIQRLTCVASNQEDEHAFVEFDVPNSGDATVQFKVEGEDDKVVIVSNRIEEEVLRTKQWYSAVTKQDLIGGILLVAFFVVLIWGAIEFITWWAQGSPRVPREETVENFRLPTRIGIFYFTASIFGFGCFVAALFALRDLSFPKGEFTIGDGESRFAATRFWRRLVGSGVLLSLSVSLIAAFIWNSFSS